MDGLGYPASHIDFVLKNGMDAWALTDHGNGSGLAHAQSHAKKMKKAGHKYRQLNGVEFYFVPSLKNWATQYQDHMDEVRAARSEKKARESTDIDADDEGEGGHVIENEDETKEVSPIMTKDDEWKRRYHLVVIAKNKQGLANLFTLVKRSFKEGYYRFPRIDFDMLKAHGEGLVVSTACLTGDAELITELGPVSLERVVRRCEAGEIPLALSYNESTGQAEFKPVTWGAVTRKNAKLLKITTADGKTVRLTPDHKVLTNKGWMQAQDLSSNMPLKIMSI
jgi:DNA polymerase III alpha subunit